MDAGAQHPGRVGAAQAPATRAPGPSSIGNEVAGDPPDPERAEAAGERGLIGEDDAEEFDASNAEEFAEQELDDGRAALERLDERARGPRGDLLTAGGLGGGADRIEGVAGSPTSSLWIYVVLTLAFLGLADPLLDVLTGSNVRSPPARWLILVLQHPVRSLLALLLLSLALRPGPHGGRPQAGRKHGAGL